MPQRASLPMISTRRGLSFPYDGKVRHAPHSSECFTPRSPSPLLLSPLLLMAMCGPAAGSSGFAASGARNAAGFATSAGKKGEDPPDLAKMEATIKARQALAEEFARRKAKIEKMVQAMQAEEEREAAINVRDTERKQQQLRAQEERIKQQVSAARTAQGQEGEQESEQGKQDHDREKSQQNTAQEQSVAVSRRGLLKRPKARTTIIGTDKKEGLVAELHRRIHFRGPISLAEYMQECLSHPTHGYYQKKDVFGSKGDFITSPEISQLFGECLGIWVASTWQSLGSPSKFALVELGPGRGTLAMDILRTIKQFPDIYKTVELHLVETSAYMREKQRQTLAVALDEMPLPKEGEPVDPKQMEERMRSQQVAGRIKGTNIRVYWHWLYQDVPNNYPFLVIGHEFLDALPIHRFIKTKQGWREYLVDMVENSAAAQKEKSEAEEGSGEEKKEAKEGQDQERTPQKEKEEFRLVVARSQTPASAAFMEGKGWHRVDVPEGDEEADDEAVKRMLKYERGEVEDEDKLAEERKELLRKLQAVENKAASIAPNSWVTTAESGEGEGKRADKPLLTTLEDAPIGTEMEVCPAAMALMEDVVKRLDQRNGAALFIDYGNPKYATANSLRGIRNHQFVSPFSSPGEIDLSADVDFYSLAGVARNYHMRRGIELGKPPGGVAVYPAITQRVLLRECGIAVRAEHLLEQNENLSDDDAELLASQYFRLIGTEEEMPGAMGEVYHALCIASKAIGPPVGFHESAPLSTDSTFVPVDLSDLRGDSAAARPAR
eukprot:g45549.t1